MTKRQGASSNKSFNFIFKRINGPKNFKFHTWVKKCHFGSFSEIGWLAGLAMPCLCSPQKRLTDFFFLFYISIFIYLFKYETVVRSSASSFGDSDPDPNSVIYTKTWNQFIYLLIGHWSDFRINLLLYVIELPEALIGNIY